MPPLRPYALAVLVACAVGLAACESSSPLTAPDPSGSARAAGSLSGATAGVVVHEMDTSDPEAIVDYWTDDRMRSALPVESVFGFVLPQTQSPFGLGFQGWPDHVTGLLHRSVRGLHPHTSIGKVFFVLNGFNFVCSASAITTEGRWGEGSRNLVLTAGHCLNNGFGGFASNFVFVPGYDRGMAPFGVWPAERLYTTPEWHLGHGRTFARDVGFARVGDLEGTELHDVVDPLGIVFTKRFSEDGLRERLKTREGTVFALFGYGVPQWGGEDPVRTLSRLATRDLNFDPSPLGVPSSHTSGASGGPWIYRYAPGWRTQGLNLVGSVNSYVYGGIDQMYGPLFDKAIHGLWAFAASE